MSSPSNSNPTALPIPAQRQYDTHSAAAVNESLVLLAERVRSMRHDYLERERRLERKLLAMESNTRWEMVCSVLLAIAGALCCVACLPPWLLPRRRFAVETGAQRWKPTRIRQVRRVSHIRV